ncbi:hypothetical protein MPNT_30089 [Candidatus Methylacidithermus pantelleriae]|uniref:Uncharacterized protein n=2 Tax=Candidatus Methylacidithermus pantelleriae TaxID=2744239 RepID=A0A8J2FNZ5_9BACT|nr:hypothetical protein MPNT_30089 [Candidatus Methylacidithermus pantelleriae]
MLVIERLDLCKRKLKVESVGFVRARSLPSATGNAMVMVKSAFFCPGAKAIELGPALQACDRRGKKLGTLSSREFSPGCGLVFLPTEDWVSPNAHPCQRQSCLLERGVMSPSSYPEAIGRSSYGRFSRWGSGETPIGASPVGRQSAVCDGSVPEIAGIGYSLGFASETPAREFSGALFSAGVPDNLPW